MSADERLLAPELPHSGAGCNGAGNLPDGEQRVRQMQPPSANKTSSYRNKRGAAVVFCQVREYSESTNIIS